MHRHLIPKCVGVVVLLTAFGGGAAYAFTAGNTVNASLAGEGAGAVSGFWENATTWKCIGDYLVPAADPPSGESLSNQRVTPEWCCEFAKSNGSTMIQSINAVH